MEKSKLVEKVENGRKGRRVEWLMTTSCGWWWLSGRGGSATGCTQSAGVSQAGRTHTGGATYCHPACRRCHTTESEIKGCENWEQPNKHQRTIFCVGIACCSGELLLFHAAILSQASLSSSPTLITIKQARQHFLMQTHKHKSK